MKDLWNMLLDAQEQMSGIPSQLVEESKQLMKQRWAEDDRIKKGIEKSTKREGRTKHSQNRIISK